MRKHLVFAAATSLVLAAAAAASAADPQGPPFGANRYAAAVKTVCAVPDTDDYVATLVAGEKLNVAVLAAKGSLFRPEVTLVGPDGAAFAPAGLRVTANGKSASLRNWAVPRTGRWGVRVAGAGGSEGAYTIAFSVGAAPRVAAKGLELANPSDCVVPFEGIDGAKVDVTVTWKQRRSSVTLSSISTPHHVAIPGVVPVVRANSISVKGLVLGGGDGTYELRLARGSGSPVCDVSVRVTPKGRPKSARTVKLGDAEPYLDLVPAPVRGIAGIHVRLAGGNFSAGDPPTVLFGGRPAISYVLPGGAALDAIAPEGTDGSLVSVAVIGSDGQSCVRDGYFRYVPAPVISDLVDEHHASVRVLRASGGQALSLRGTGFDEVRSVFLGTTPVAFTALSATQLEIVTPAFAANSRLVVRDEFGRDGLSGFVVACAKAPQVVSIAATGGTFLDPGHAAVAGGTTVRLTGTNFLATDRVTLGGAVCTVVAVTPGSLTFTTPTIGSGLADLVVTDEFGQSTKVDQALHVVGFEDASASRAPAKSAADALTASRGAVADLDGDGLVNDLVLVSDGDAPGTRAERTRVFLGASGTLADVTNTHFPGAFSDAAGVDSWTAGAVALGDLGGDGTADILIGGLPVEGTGADPFEARLFENDGTANFLLEPASPAVRSAPWTVTDGLTISPLFTPKGTNGGRVTALAIGDLDGDGRADVVLGTDRFRTGAAHVPLDLVTFYGDDAVTPDLSSAWDPVGTTTDSPALRVFLDRRDGGDGFVDSTFTRLPRGEASPGLLPAYHVRDLVLGDVNGDGALDIVLTWDDPRSVTPYGLANPGADDARVATRVLINDGAGFFTDETDSRVPAATGDEYWQAARLTLADLDGDGDLDLVLLNREAVDAWTGAPTHASPALRILRNDGGSFTAMPASSLPPVPLAGTADDDLRGTGLAVLDFDDDGVLDLAVGTDSPLGGAARSLRLLHGTGNLGFTDAAGFLPSASADSGEAADVLPVTFGGGAPSLVLVAPATPVHSAGGANLRVFDWTK